MITRRPQLIFQHFFTNLTDENINKDNISLEKPTQKYAAFEGVPTQNVGRVKFLS